MECWLRIPCYLPLCVTMSEESKAEVFSSPLFSGVQLLFASKGPAWCLSHLPGNSARSERKPCKVCGKDAGKIVHGAAGAPAVRVEGPGFVWSDDKLPVEVGSPHCLQLRQDSPIGRIPLVVSTDASLKEWVLCLITWQWAGAWTPAQSRLHINQLELLAAFQALQHFCYVLRCHHVLIRADNTTVYNRQGGALFSSVKYYPLSVAALIFCCQDVLTSQDIWPWERTCSPEEILLWENGGFTQMWWLWYYFRKAAVWILPANLLRLGCLHETYL